MLRALRDFHSTRHMAPLQPPGLRSKPTCPPVDTASDQDLMPDTCSAHLNCIISPSLYITCMCLYGLIGDVSPINLALWKDTDMVGATSLVTTIAHPTVRLVPHFLPSFDPLYYSMQQLREQYIVQDFAFQGKYFNFPRDFEISVGVGICFSAFMLSPEKEAKQRLRHGMEGNSLSRFSKSFLILTWR